MKSKNQAENKQKHKESIFGLTKTEMIEKLKQNLEENNLSEAEKIDIQGLINHLESGKDYFSYHRG
ncbi:MAG: hypothetical protein GBAus27B_000439 [Mycoplasmataceae bacterium]|nr:MAG: hypothetical protein GBAus27B_000439 [Mycoplasmataceae bacterium]